MKQKPFPDETQLPIDLSINLDIEIKDENPEKNALVMRALEEAVLNKKSDIHCNLRENLVTLHLRRIRWKSRKILWFRCFESDRRYSKPCILTIRKVQDFKLNEGSCAPDRQEVGIIVDIQRDKILIASGVEHDIDDFLISITVGAIDMHLQDADLGSDENGKY